METVNFCGDLLKDIYKILECFKNFKFRTSYTVIHTLNIAMSALQCTWKIYKPAILKYITSLLILIGLIENSSKLCLLFLDNFLK